MKTNILYIFISLFVLYSCTQDTDVTIQSDESDRLVVEGMITDEHKAHRIMLHVTKDYLQNEQLSPATGATVIISDGFQDFRLSENTPGVYTTDTSVYGIVGRIYTLRIIYNAVEYTAQSLLKNGAFMGDLYFQKDAMNNIPNQLPYYTIFSEFKDSEQSDEYFLFKMNLNKVAYDSISNFMLTADEYINQFQGVVMVGYHQVKYGDTVEIESYSITKEYFDFVVAANSALQVPIPFFSGPPVNIVGNISNGALGFFTASATSKSKTIFNEMNDLDYLSSQNQE